jgi:hypothetical protein
MTSKTFAAVPRYISPVPEGTDITGAYKASIDLRVPLLPQGEMIAEVMEARREDGRPLYRNVVVQVPRRSSKTSSIQSVLLGRCFNIPGYQVVSTAQTQKIARKVFIDMVHVLDVAYPDPDNRPYKARVGNGQEDIRWDNGSVWWVVAPRSGSFRSSAADAVWFDEAGEYTLEQTDDLVQSALPLMDTKPQGQVIISGTPSTTRAGMLWDYLTVARKGKPRYGIVDFSMDPMDDPTDQAVWWKVHAGLAAGLTELDVIEERFEKMSLIQFQREYLCADPVASSIRAIPEEDWIAGQVPEMLALPASNFSIAFDTTQSGDAGAVAVAWYTPDGLPHVQILEHKGGINWLPAYLEKLLKNHKGAEIGFDSIGNNLATFQTLQRKRGISTVNLRSMTMKEVAGGVSLMTSHIADRALVHAKDKSLDTAAEAAAFRYSGDSRLWSRGNSNEDISPLIAASNALYIAAGKRHKEPYKKRAPRTF